MRHAKRTDENHRQVVDGVREALPCATIFDASGAGKGFPDLVVGWRGRNYLFEIKNPDKPPSGRKLTKAQVFLHENWQGQIDVVTSAAGLVSSMLKNQPKT